MSELPTYLPTYLWPAGSQEPTNERGNQRLQQQSPAELSKEREKKKKEREREKERKRRKKEKERKKKEKAAAKLRDHCLLAKE